MRAARPLSAARRPFAESYDPRAVEAGRMAWWRALGAAPAAADAPRFTMLLPPPNVTGSLHIGHALTATIEDSLVRWRRMCGDNVQWIPGTDHAGIATQTVVERDLVRTQGVDRHALGRDEFVRRVWAWREQYGERIYEQLDTMGASLDHDARYFTLDDDRSRFVTDSFVRLHRKGLVYRDNRIVNWCPSLRTVISDIEVDTMSIDAKPTPVRLPGRAKPVTFGLLYSIAYPVEGSESDTLVVSTTRPETLFGDVALAVHPEDARYAHLIGRRVLNPITGAPIPVIGDAVLVDRDFGTGVVKVTPAHDAADYDVAQRHSLPLVEIFDDAGALSSASPGVVPAAFAGLDRFDARFRVLAELTARGRLVGRDPHAMQLAQCSRSGDVLEPRVRPQWYVRCRGALADRARDMVERDIIKIEPAYGKADWLRWLDDCRDWCVSRQLWWGHRIPAYRLAGNDGNNGDKEQWFVAPSMDEAAALAKKGGFLTHNAALEQDPDVLDTWFSSALLPISAVPDARRRPLDVMETGGDILTFWVSRMVMLCSHLDPSGAPPFRRVLLHPMVRDSSGRKMSKSLGNVVDPMNVVRGATLAQLRDELTTANIAPDERKRGLEGLNAAFPRGIAASGADALRFALVRSPQHAHFLNLDMTRVAASRVFGNKLWNAVRFLDVRWPSDAPFEPLEKVNAAAHESIAEQWLLTEFAQHEQAVNAAMEAHDLADAAERTFHFVRDVFCDVYIEWVKALDDAPGEQKRALMLGGAVMEALLRILFPFTPFIAEELWQHLTVDRRADQWPQSIGHRSYPKDTAARLNVAVSERAAADMDVILGVLAEVRAAAKKANDRGDIAIGAGGESQAEVVAKHAKIIANMAGVKSISVNMS